MDQFDKLLKKLNQNLSSTSKKVKTPKPKPIPPRQFPKKQYQKYTRKLWILIGSIIICVLVIGGIVIGECQFQTSRHQASHSHIERPVRPKHRAKKASCKHKSIPHKAIPKLSPKQGEKLLGHWLIKLHYSPIQSQRILNIYQHSSTYEESAITQRLTKSINNSNLSTAQKQNAVKNYLHQKFSSTN